MAPSGVLRKLSTVRYTRVMPLHLRIRHALGESTHSLPERGVDDPLYVGRAKTAAVQVPSMAVSSTHCALFIHDGRWVIQDAGSRGGTFINGLRAAQPTMLKRGDVVTLGREADSATIRVLAIDDADGLAATGPAQAAAEFDNALAEDDDNIFAPPTETLAVSSVVAAAAPRRRPPSKAGKIVVAASAFSVIAGALGAAYYVLEKTKVAGVSSNDKTSVTAPAAAKPPGLKTKLFAPAAATVPSDAPAFLSNAGVKEVAPPPPDPLREDPAFVGVSDAFRNEQPEVALNTLLAFKGTHARSPLIGEIDTMIESALDALWWKRIDRIFAQRQRNAEALAEMTQYLAVVPAAEKEATERQIKATRSEDASLVAELTTEMAFDDPAPPDLDSPAALAAARGKRDAKRYAEWKTRVITSLTLRRGALPWG